MWCTQGPGRGMLEEGAKELAEHSDTPEGLSRGLFASRMDDMKTSALSGPRNTCTVV